MGIIKPRPEEGNRKYRTGKLTCHQFTFRHVPTFSYVRYVANMKLKIELKSPNEYL